MNTDALFKELDPPPRGAERFARRLDEIAAERPSSRMRLLAMAASVAAVALVTTVLLLQPASDVPPASIANAPPPVDVYNAPELDRLLGRAAAPAELMVTVNMATVATTEIETTNERVRIYQIN
jgi:hypothetical protein